MIKAVHRLVNNKELTGNQYIKYSGQIPPIQHINDYIRHLQSINKQLHISQHHTYTLMFELFSFWTLETEGIPITYNGTDREVNTVNSP